MKINGSLIQAYIICPRKSWLMSRQISGDQYNEFLAIGRLYAEESFKREKKEVLLGGNKLDIVKESEGTFTVIETKKSSKMIKASKMQLLNYLYFFSKKGYIVKGEIRIPKEKKIIHVEFGEDEKKIIESLHNTINTLVDQDHPPEKKRIGVCKNCSYMEFCWS